MHAHDFDRPPGVEWGEKLRVLLIAVLFVGLLLAYANGANDNLKGVATLLGSGTARYRGALVWATVTTALGSLTALVLARGLLAAFSGKGLVPPEVALDPLFPTSVALAAGATVLVATRLGLPVSTTHALIGGLIGAGLVASPTGIDGSQLTRSFLAPLLVSPVLAVVLGGLVYPPLRGLRKSLGVSRETCICLGEEVLGLVPAGLRTDPVLRSVTHPVLTIGTSVTCVERYRGRVLGSSAHRVLEAAHYLSAGAVSFARGLNDTPKIAALLLVGGAFSPTLAIVGVGLAIATGGLLHARRVADTMAHRVTDMNPGQGFSANLVTAFLVIGASRLGLPVSTTHVSCGSLFGIGSVTRQAHWRTIGGILLAWVFTLPVAGLLGFLLVKLLPVLS